MILNAIIHPRFRKSEVYQYLQIKQEHISGGICADIICHEIVPSLAVLILAHSDIELDPSQAEYRVKTLASQFRNAWVIVVETNSDNMDTLCEWQFQFGAASVQFLFVETHNSAALKIQELYRIMTQKEKIDKQRSFFQQLHQQSTSSATANQIYRDTLETMEVNEEDIETLISDYPTMQSLIVAVEQRSLSKLQDNSARINLMKLFS